MQKTIYIKDAATWEGIRDEAKGNGLSVSGYLVGLHQEKNFRSLGGGPDLCSECGQNGGHRDDCSKYVAQDGEDGFVQDPEPQPEQAKMKKVEKSLKPDPIQKAEKDLEKLRAKLPKRDKKGNCVECGSQFGHRSTCSGRVE